MTFQTDKANVCKALFEEQKDKIRHFALWQYTFHTNIFFPYSCWDDEVALAAYRNSDLFTCTWQQTKQMLQQKPKRSLQTRLLLCLSTLFLQNT